MPQHVPYVTHVPEGTRPRSRSTFGRPQNPRLVGTWLESAERVWPRFPQGRKFRRTSMKIINIILGRGSDRQPPCRDLLRIARTCCTGEIRLAAGHRYYRTLRRMLVVFARRDRPHLISLRHDRYGTDAVTAAVTPPRSSIPQRASSWFSSGFSSMSWLRLPHVSSKTATTAVPMSVGCCVNTTPLLVSRACSTSMSSTAN
jgi:hypothetical protein